jgi:hypothetical protein
VLVHTRINRDFFVVDCGFPCQPVVDGHQQEADEEKRSGRVQVHSKQRKGVKHASMPSERGTDLLVYELEGVRGKEIRSIEYVACYGTDMLVLHFTDETSLQIDIGARAGLRVQLNSSHGGELRSLRQYDLPLFAGGIVWRI